MATSLPSLWLVLLVGHICNLCTSFVGILQVYRLFTSFYWTGQLGTDFTLFIYKYYVLCSFVCFGFGTGFLCVVLAALELSL